MPFPTLLQIHGLFLHRFLLLAHVYLNIHLYSQYDLLQYLLLKEKIQWQESQMWGLSHSNPHLVHMPFYNCCDCDETCHMMLVSCLSSGSDAHFDPGWLQFCGPGNLLFLLAEEVLSHLFWLVHLFPSHLPATHHSHVLVEPPTMQWYWGEISRINISDIKIGARKM